jgi:hypothetical protein
MRKKRQPKPPRGKDATTGPGLPPKPVPTAGEKRWALVRIALGLAQVMAATATAYLLVVTGVSPLTVWAAAGTVLLVVLSKLLFRGTSA